MSIGEQAISVQCGQCSHGFRVKAKGAGKIIACPSCKTPVQVPWPDPPAPWPNHVASTPAHPPEPDAYAPAESLPEISVDPSARPASRLPRSRSYPVLEALAVVLRVCGYLLATLASLTAIGGIVLAIRFSGDDATAVAFMWAVISMPAAVVAIIISMLMVMLAEMINLAIDIQDNTLVAARR